jgi:hypothetical protein
MKRLEIQSVLGKLMINVDAAFDIDSRTGGAGAVLSELNGACLVATNRYLPHAVDAGMAEAVKHTLCEKVCCLLNSLGFPRSLFKQIVCKLWRLCKMEVSRQRQRLLDQPQYAEYSPAIHEDEAFQ